MYKVSKGITKEERLNVIEWSYEFFKHVIDKNYFCALVAQETNWDKSAKLIDSDGKILGVYLLGDQQISSTIKDTEYDNLKGVEGVLLAVDTSIRGQGWGNKLKDYPKTLGVDYVWGQQFKTLNNLQDWLKRRILVAEYQGVYVTLEDFRK